MNPEAFREMDRSDPLARLRERFDLPAGTVYLNGHSLGALPLGVSERLERLVQTEWGKDLVAGWNVHDWIGLPKRVGDRIARLLGAAPGQVICADSISVNLFKLLSTALSMQADRRVILSQQDNFPTDLYMAEGLASLLGPDRCRLRSVPAERLLDALDDQIAVLMLTQVNFRDGRLHDIRTITEAAHARGVMVLWDLAHSAGVLPLELDEWQVDMAVGCGYKYLNGGPGAPAFLYLAQRHHDHARQPLSGWMGHAQPFAFDPVYEPAGGVQRYLAGTPGILGMTALDVALDLFEDLDIDQVRERSIALTQAFIDALAALRLEGVSVLTPTDPAQRGSQVSIAHEKSWAISQALIARGVMVDFRAPDVIRFGFSPLYNRFADVGAAIDVLSRVLSDKSYLDPAFARKKKVT